MLPIISAVASGIADFIGGQQANAQNRQTSLDQMMFQKEMSDTAHRREVVDLRAAGLNPILSARYGGSSTPAGSTWTAQNVLGQAVNSARSSLLTAADYKLKRQEERIKEPVARAADKATAGFDAIDGIIPAVSSAVSAAVTTALDKVDEVRGIALGTAAAARQTGQEGKAVVNAVREVINTPGQSFSSTARQIREILLPKVRGEFALKPDNPKGQYPHEVSRAISQIADPLKRRQAAIALEQQQIRRHNPTFSRFGFK